MALKIGINGLGRIGRELVYQILNLVPNDVEIVAINDENISSVLEVLYFLTYNSTNLGRRTNYTFSRVSSSSPSIQVQDSTGGLVYAGRDIQFFNKSIEEVSTVWVATGAQVVVDCTGHTDLTYLSYHKDGDVGKVFHCGVSADDDFIVFPGVNDSSLSDSSYYIGLGDAASQAIAVVANLLNTTYLVNSISGTIVKAYTNDQTLLDGPKSNCSLERCRAAAENIVPSAFSTLALNRGLPELAGKFYFNSFNVPVSNGSCIHLVCDLNGSTINISNINNALNNTNKHFVGYENSSVTNGGQYLVSSDIIGRTTAINILPYHTYVENNNTVHIVGLYDNESGFAAQIVRALQSL